MSSCKKKGEVTQLQSVIKTLSSVSTAIVNSVFL